MRTLHADLTTAQTAGYPTGGYKPAVRCILTSKDGGTTYDYSFDPTVTTNRLIHIQQTEEKYSDPGVILLSNYDRAIPTNITGYYVDVGWGHNTASGNKWDTGAGAVAPRMWVMSQSDISGGTKSSQPQLYTSLAMSGVWDAVLNRQPVLTQSYPVRDIDIHRHDENYWMLSLMNKTIYEVLEQLIQNELSAQTGLSFTLDALGSQDDGQISTVIPFPTELEDSIRYINADSPFYFQTYGSLIRSLLELTKCVLVPRAGLNFRIMYPQASDAVNETYHSSVSDGHPFYEVENRRLNMIPNHIEVYGGLDETYGIPAASGHWFDTDHYSGWVSPAETATYDGSFMPVKASGSTDNELWETKLDTDAECRVRAAELGWQLKDQILGTRVIVPMDARVELYDRIEIQDQRGH